MTKVNSLIFILCGTFISNIFSSDKKIPSLEGHSPKSLLTESIKKYLANKKNYSYQDESTPFFEKSDNQNMTKQNKSMLFVVLRGYWTV